MQNARYNITHNATYCIPSSFGTNYRCTEYTCTRMYMLCYMLTKCRVGNRRYLGNHRIYYGLLMQQDYINQNNKSEGLCNAEPQNSVYTVTITMYILIHGYKIYIIIMYCFYGFM